MRRVIPLAISAVVLLAGTPARGQDRRAVNALETWVNAVNAHIPGKADSAAGFVAALKYSDRAILDPAMRLFLAAVRGNSIVTKSDEHQKVLEIYHAVRVNPGLAPFLERAAVLHADAAIFRDKFPDFVDDAPPVMSGTTDMSTGSWTGRGNRPPTSPLLANEAAMLHTDGRVVGQSALNWNWPFARSLLDLLVRKPPDDKGVTNKCDSADCTGRVVKASDIATDADVAFVTAWYHATSAYMLATGKHADLKWHLLHATVVFPQHAHILFDRACYAETLGLPLYQALPGDPGFWNRTSHISMDVPSEDKTDDEAEQLFRRTIDVDPNYAEARVRLARLLERRGLHDQAAAQVELALSGNAPQTVTFFAHLVSGRIEQARGRAQESLAQYRAALTVFPRAQSALLGASQAAVIASDLPAALAFVTTLSDRNGDARSDPWWLYDLGAGRDVDALMASLWAHVQK